MMLIYLSALFSTINRQIEVYFSKEISFYQNFRNLFTRENVFVNINAIKAHFGNFPRESWEF